MCVASMLYTLQRAEMEENKENEGWRTADRGEWIDRPDGSAVSSATIDRRAIRCNRIAWSEIQLPCRSPGSRSCVFLLFGYVQQHPAAPSATLVSCGLCVRPFIAVGSLLVIGIARVLSASTTQVSRSFTDFLHLYFALYNY